MCATALLMTQYFSLGHAVAKSHDDTDHVERSTSVGEVCIRLRSVQSARLHLHFFAQLGVVPCVQKSALYKKWLWQAVKQCSDGAREVKR